MFYLVCVIHLGVDFYVSVLPKLNIQIFTTYSSCLYIVLNKFLVTQVLKPLIKFFSETLRTLLYWSCLKDRI